MQPPKSCQAPSAVEISASSSFDGEYKSRLRETFSLSTCHTKNRGQIDCPSEWNPPCGSRRQGHSGIRSPLIATATPASPLARSERLSGVFLNRDSPQKRLS